MEETDINRLLSIPENFSSFCQAHLYHQDYFAYCIFIWILDFVYINSLSNVTETKTHSRKIWSHIIAKFKYLCFFFMFDIRLKCYNYNWNIFKINYSVKVYCYSFGFRDINLARNLFKIKSIQVQAFVENLIHSNRSIIFWFAVHALLNF